MCIWYIGNVWECLKLSFWVVRNTDVTQHSNSIILISYTLLTRLIPRSHWVATGHDSANRHWSLIVAPSQRLVANVRCTVSKYHGNEKIIFISATQWTVARLSGIVEKQLRHSRVGVARLICKKNYAIMAERCECTTTMSQLSPNSGVTNGDCNGKMTSVRDNRATNNNYITTTLQQHFCKNWNNFLLFRKIVILFYLF